MLKTYTFLEKCKAKDKRVVNGAFPVKKLMLW